MTGGDDRQREDMNADVDRTTRHNRHIRSAAVVPGRHEGGELEGYLSLNGVAQKANMSIKHIRMHLEEIPHYRFSKHGKIWLRWNDFAVWMERRRTELKGDDSLIEILRDLTNKARQ
jgi:hypothetical protein